MKLRHWLRIHRESIITIAIIVLIFAGLIIIWGGGDGEDDPHSTGNVWVPDPSTISHSKGHDDVAAERTMWEQASVNSRTTTTVRVSRGGAKTRTVLPKVPATSSPPSNVWAALRQCENGGSYTSQPATDTAVPTSSIVGRGRG